MIGTFFSQVIPSSFLFFYRHGLKTSAFAKKIPATIGLTYLARKKMAMFFSGKALVVQVLFSKPR